VSLAYDELGAGPALVLIHGHPFDRRMWTSQLEALSGALRVIAPDLPGYGASPPRDDPMTMAALADAVLELLDELDVHHAVAAGLSMGGLVAMELGLRDPDRIDGLVLAATTAAPVTPEEARTRRETAERLERDGMLDHALDMAGRLFGPAARRDPDLVEPVLSMMLHAQPSGAAAALRGRAERPDYSRLLRELLVPTLVIAGD
jgi:pimeloyl-ACP methyl ester carboxylesterase